MRSHRRRSVFLFLWCMLCVAAPAHAIANPFLIYATLSLSLEFLLGVFLLLPFWLCRARLLCLASPWRRRALVAGLVLTFMGVFYFGIPDWLAEHRGCGGGETYASTCFPIGRFAETLGVGEEDILLDVRLPAQYAMYHIRGTCNADPQSLLRDKAFREQLQEKGRRIYLVSEFRQVTASLYGDLLDDGCSTDTWRILEAGVMFFRYQKDVKDRPSVLNNRMTHEEASSFRDLNSPDLFNKTSAIPLLDHDATCFLPHAKRLGQQLAYKNGPAYARGQPWSIIGNHPAWRQRCPAFLFDEEAKSLTKILVEDVNHLPRVSDIVFPGTGQTLVTGVINTSVEALDRVHGAPIQSVVFLCGDIVTCSAAETLAKSILGRGDAVYGYVLEQEHPYYLSFRDMPRAVFLHHPFDAAPWLLAGLAILVAMGIRGHVETRLARPHPAPAGHGAAIPREWFVRVGGGVAPLLIWAMHVETSNHLVEASRGLGGIFLSDAVRTGHPLISLFPPVIVLLLAAVVLRFQPRVGGTWASRASWAAYWAAVALAVLLIQTLDYTRQPTAFNAGVFAAILAAPCAREALGILLYWRARIIHVLHGGSPPGITVVPLAFSDWDIGRSQKTRWLAQSAGCGVTIPEGYVVSTTIQAYRSLHADAPRRLRRALSPMFRSLRSGLLVVRSAAPGEDEAGALTAGRYTTLRNVRHEDVPRSILEVIESYARGGIPPTTPVSVLIQEQVAAQLGGVACREGAHQGGSILVEAAEQDTVSVTAGNGAPLWGRIGASSGEWISG
ncbi:MAG: hypothetical protein WC943_10630, partial [Elusimicrobiota bacterium]